MKAKSIKDIASMMHLTANSMNIVQGFAVDSRLVKPGDLFFALPGEHTDGHVHLAEAISKGAVGAVVQTGYRGTDYGAPLLHSQNVLQSLQDLAKKALKESRAPIIAVTGSLGKTTTKEFIATLLRTKYKVFVSPGNSNSQIGLPLSILNHATLREEVMVLEMGMTEKGQISRLIEIAPPTVALVTFVSLVHACNFDSIEDIAKSKAEIFSHPNTELGIFHAESDYGNALSSAGKCPKLMFSTTDPSAEFYMQPSPNGLSLCVSQCERIDFSALLLPGKHNILNLLAAIAVARNFGLEWEEIKSGKELLALPERRLQFIQKLGALFVNDSYNASEMSIKAALDSLPKPNAGSKRIAVLGGIVELGKFSEQCHRAVGEYALQHVDTLVCFGEECGPIVSSWKAAKRPVVWAKERSEIIQALHDQLKPGDVVLLKGSRAKGLWKVLDELHP